LTALADPEDQRTAWAAAQEIAKDEGKPVAARHVEMAVDEVKPRATRFTMPARGLFIARGAISQLQQILPGDKERDEALRLVAEWCNKQLRKTSE
jgi:hypothetical protein